MRFVTVALVCCLSLVGVTVRALDRWDRVPCPVADPLHNGFFVDAVYGWIISYGTGAILHTEDAGKTWRVEARVDSLYYESLFFLDRGRGWLCGERGSLLRTEDGGKTWVRESRVPETVAFYGVRFIDSERALLVGMDVGDRRGVVLVSPDAGVTWREHPDSVPPSFYESIYFPNPRVGFIAGGRFVLGTNDGGRTWRAADLGGDVVIRGIHFSDLQRGCVVGHTGVVYRTVDGGRSWRRLENFTRNRLRSVYFLDPDTGFIAGDSDQEKGSLWQTTDGGETWGRVPQDYPDLHRLIAGPGGVWAVGKSGTILQYRQFRHR